MATTTTSARKPTATSQQSRLDDMLSRPVQEEKNSQVALRRITKSPEDTDKKIDTPVEEYKGMGTSSDTQDRRNKARNHGNSNDVGQFGHGNDGENDGDENGIWQVSSFPSPIVPQRNDRHNDRHFLSITCDHLIIILFGFAYLNVAYLLQLWPFNHKE